MGIALASTVAMWAQFLVLYWSWEKRHSFFADFAATMYLMVKITLIAGAGFAVCFGVKSLLVPQVGAVSLIQNIVVAAAAGIPALAVVTVCLHVARIADVREIALRLIKRA
jgi:peptidoglycan biosynthesis protein MviN/MurJ (putative lipid II flippase)